MAVERARLANRGLRLPGVDSSDHETIVTVASGAPRRALGISVHTGWGACVVVGGSPQRPEVIANQVVEILGDAERFCFHRAAEMDRGQAAKWIERTRKAAVENSKKALSHLLAKDVELCAIVAKPGEVGPLESVLASHPRIHTAEGCFYRDVFRDACGVPVRIIPPASLDVSAIGRITGPPWGRDQKLAALAAWRFSPARKGRGF